MPFKGSFKDISLRVSIMATSALALSFGASLVNTLLHLVGGNFVVFDIFSRLVLFVGAALMIVYNKLILDGKTYNMFLYGAAGLLVLGYLIGIIDNITHFHKDSVFAIILSLVVAAALGATVFFHKKGNVQFRKIASFVALGATAIVKLIDIANVFRAPFLPLVAGLLEILGSILVFGAVVCTMLDDSTV